MPPKKAKKGGFHNRFEPTTTQEINESPSVLFNFQEVGCLDFCQRVEDVTNHPPLMLILQQDNELSGKESPSLSGPVGYFWCKVYF